MDLLCFCSVLCLLCLCACLFTCALWSSAGKGLASFALLCGVLLWVCHFPIGILGQVWYLIVSIPDLCTLTYLYSAVLIPRCPIHHFHKKQFCYLNFVNAPLLTFTSQSTAIFMLRQSVYLTTLFPGQAWLSGYPVLCAHTFACNLQQPFLNQQKEDITRTSDNTYSKCSKILNTVHFLFSEKIWVIRAGIHKMLVRIANREDCEQTASSEASSEAVWSGSSLFVQAFLTGN